MARVVQRRSSPPYLLIVFVFLFLIAGILAVLFHLKASEANEKYQADKLKWSKFVSDEHLKDNEIQQWLKQYDQADVPQTVIAQLKGQIKNLVQDITGMGGSYEQAKAEIDKLSKETDGAGFSSLIEEIHKLREKNIGANTQGQSWRKKYDDLVTELAKAREQLKAIAKTYDADITEHNNTISDLGGQLKKEHGEYLAKVEKLEKEFGQAAAELNRKIASLNQTLQVKQVEIQRKNARIAELEDKLRKGKGGVQKLPQPDGTIMRIVDGTDRCYINIGAKDRVMLGLTFSVYPASGIPKSGEGKGKIVVTKVGKNISECRIMEQRKDDPIIRGDLISNIAFDPNLVYKFVVEGEFDLQGTGQPTEAGAKTVKALIKRFGGKVVNELNVDTDFVVIGTEPPRPPKPAETAPPQVWQVYQEQMKVYRHYNDIKAAAVSLHIPVLNTNRFLAFIGYTAPKGAKKD